MGALTPPEIVLLVIAGAALALLLGSRVRPDLVAVAVLLALGLAGVLPPDRALAGFGSPAVLTIVGLFVVTAGLERTGVVGWLAERLAALSGRDERRTLLVFMLAGALLSLLMNNIAAGAVLLPSAVGVVRRTGVPPSKVLMPLAFGTLLGGMATLFTTANLIVSGTLEARGQRPLTMLDFLPAGGAMVLAGTAYMVLAGRRLLPRRESVGREALARTDLTATYQLGERLWEVRVHPGSPLVGQPLAESVIGARLGVTVIAIWRGREATFAPRPEERIAAGDILLVLGREERVRQLEAQGTTIGRSEGDRHGPELGVHLTEVVIAPRSPVSGKTLKELHFRTRYGLTTVALWREARSYRTDVGDFRLQPGDALLMVGGPERIRQLAEEPGFIVLDDRREGKGRERPVRATGKALWAALVTGLALALAATGLVSTAEAVLAGAVAMVLIGCLGMEDAYRAIEWRVIVLIAGFLPLGAALETTGLAERLGRALTATLGGAGPLALTTGLYLLAVLLTQLVGGQVAALVAAPVAVSAALRLGVDPTAVGVAVAMGCSAAFLTPIAHPVNVLMMGPGGYTPKDFLRVGLGMVAVCLLTLLVVLPLLWTL